MENRINIPPERFRIEPYGILERQWFLLTSGDFHSGHFNAMTISWGSLGKIWNKPFVQVVVRPSRYTYQFMEQYSSFTVCAFPLQYREALSLLGTQSGRTSNKIAESGLTPIPSKIVAAPAYAEAELILECHKVYWQDMDSGHFINFEINSSYPEKDYHRIYFGEIVNIEGTHPYHSESD